MGVSAMEKLKKAVAIGSHAIEATTAKGLTRTTLPTTAGEGKPGNCNNNENERQRRINDTREAIWNRHPGQACNTVVDSATESMSTL